VTETAASTQLFSALRETAGFLDQRHQPWALVGGLAVSIRVEPRFTRDIDLAVSVTDDGAAESLVADLVGAGYTLKLSLEQQALGRLAAVRLLPPGQHDEGIVIDLLFVSCGIEPEICSAAERLEIAPGLTVPVAQAGHLVAMKMLALAPDRPQDGIDLRALLSQLTPEERVRAIDAVGRIEQRGANRGKALSSELEVWLGRTGSQ
jgi:hypothetical protein